MATPMPDRTKEWFVPAVGPSSLRTTVGLLFLPYTGMVLAYTAIGAMLADRIWWDRVAAILIIYFLALGIGAHALDALGSKGVKPWGAFFSKTALWLAAAVSLTLAYAIGFYYIILYVPLLALIAIPEGFFVLAYNLEWFDGHFHTDGWFALSWGTLPVLAGYMIQTNRLSIPAVIVAVSMGLLSLVEIKASRPYKRLKREVKDCETDGERRETMQRFEFILKSLSIGVILLGIGLVTLRL